MEMDLHCLEPLQNWDLAVVLPGTVAARTSSRVEGFRSFGYPLEKKHGLLQNSLIYRGVFPIFEWRSKKCPKNWQNGPYLEASNFPSKTFSPLASTLQTGFFSALFTNSSAAMMLSWKTYFLSNFLLPHWFFHTFYSILVGKDYWLLNSHLL